jgi:hypothetical protein
MCSENKVIFWVLAASDSGQDLIRKHVMRKRMRRFENETGRNKGGIAQA